MNKIDINNLLVNPKFEKTKKDIVNLYLSDDKPWVIGYSGGKDSSTLVQLVLDSISALEINMKKKPIYVISSNTLVETPPVIKRVIDSHKEIKLYADKYNLPVTTKIVSPKSEQTFWVNIIGRGYPSPNQTFRWCTDRMKIDPANQFIKDTISEFGDVIVLLGVRYDESYSRRKNIKEHEHKNRMLMRHSTLKNAYVFSPMKDFTIDDVWDYLLDSKNYFKEQNFELYRIYAESNSNECPLIIDNNIKESAGSCGNSRFGCWTCTVVDEDKSLSGYIEKGHDWLLPLLQFRNWLAEIRDSRVHRMKKRTNGKIYFASIIELNGKFIIPKKSKREKIEINSINGNWIDNFNNNWNVFNNEDEAKKYLLKNQVDLESENDPLIIAKMSDGNWGQLGLGPFTIETRIEILRRLLKTQKELSVEFELISIEEINEIRVLLRENGILDDPIRNIYKEIFGKEIENSNEINAFANDQVASLIKMSEKYDIDTVLLKKLIANGISLQGVKNRSKILKLMKTEFLSDYMNLEEIKGLDENK